MSAPNLKLVSPTPNQFEEFDRLRDALTTANFDAAVKEIGSLAHSVGDDSINRATHKKLVAGLSAAIEVLTSGIHNFEINKFHFDLLACTTHDLIEQTRSEGTADSFKKSYLTQMNHMDGDSAVFAAKYLLENFDDESTIESAATIVIETSGRCKYFDRVLDANLLVVQKTAENNPLHTAAAENWRKTFARDKDLKKANNALIQTPDGYKFKSQLMSELLAFVQPGDRRLPNNPEQAAIVCLNILKNSDGLDVYPYNIAREYWTANLDIIAKDNPLTAYKMALHACHETEAMNCSWNFPSHAAKRAEKHLQLALKEFHGRSDNSRAYNLLELQTSYNMKTLEGGVLQESLGHSLPIVIDWVARNDQAKAFVAAHNILQSVKGTIDPSTGFPRGWGSPFHKNAMKSLLKYEGAFAEKHPTAIYDHLRVATSHYDLNQRGDMDYLQDQTVVALLSYTPPSTDNLAVIVKDLAEIYTKEILKKETRDKLCETIVRLAPDAAKNDFDKTIKALNDVINHDPSSSFVTQMQTMKMRLDDAHLEAFPVPSRIDNFLQWTKGRKTASHTQGD